ncbi:MAG: NAD(P)/FAD-dependent oxidoreductase [Verrucomicrobiota bacterium]|nr:NAD(P)/FAD-dependent oxidoreductase [Verrucomicrobiota bacterium]
MKRSTSNIIIGGGAAGIFTAIRCKELDPTSEVILLEKSNQLLSKVRISGGGRCNVTHACFEPSLLAKNYPRGAKELIGPFHTFQPKDTVSWFQERGVSLKAESDGRMFPMTDSSETIIDCLMQAASTAGVEIHKKKNPLSIQKKEGQFFIQLGNEELVADQLVLATGSSSSGYLFAKSLGHPIVEPVPSLFTLNVPTSPLLDLSGISIPDAILTLKTSNFRQRGPLLLTHWGFSGPAVLKLSAWAARKIHELDYRDTLLINWTASSNAETLYQTLLQQKASSPLQTLPPLLPHKLLHRLCEALCIDPAIPLAKLPNKTLLQLACKLHADPYAVEEKTTYKQEFVTAGGVDLKSVDFKTMQSRITPGLFFAGEILNIDGVTGGFNFQNAWTTGWLAGTAMGKK